MFKTKREVRLITKFEARVKTLDEADIRAWAQREMHDIGKALTEFDRYRGTDDLAFALQASKELAILLQEIAFRVDP